MTQTQELRDLLTKLDRATPGEWVHRTTPKRPHDSGFVQAPGLPGSAYGIEILGDDEEGYPTKREDCEAICAAHNALPTLHALADLLDAQAKELEFTKKALAQATEGMMLGASQQIRSPGMSWSADQTPELAAYLTTPTAPADSQGDE